MTLQYTTIATSGDLVLQISVMYTGRTRPQYKYRVIFPNGRFSTFYYKPSIRKLIENQYPVPIGTPLSWNYNKEYKELKMERESNPESEVALPGDSFEVVDEFDVRTEETMKGHQYMTVRPGDIVEYIGPATRQGSMYRPFFRFKVHLPNKQTYIFSAPRGFIDSFVEKMEE